MPTLIRLASDQASQISRKPFDATEYKWLQLTFSWRHCIGQSLTTIQKALKSNWQNWEWLLGSPSSKTATSTSTAAQYWPLWPWKVNKMMQRVRADVCNWLKIHPPILVSVAHTNVYDQLSMTNYIGQHYLCNYCPKLEKLNPWPPKPLNIHIGQSFKSNRSIESTKKILKISIQSMR